MKILLLDIETSPNTAFVWGLFKETIPLARLIESSEVMCWSAKWLGDDVMMHDSVFRSKPQEMLAKIHLLLDTADVVVHYNGQQFDIPCLNKEFLLYGMTPPSPYKQVDLLKTVRSQFKFTSNKLDYVVQKLGIGEKLETNFQLWVDCMQRDPIAWEKMEGYNKHDVAILERLYKVLRPWVVSHPNRTLYTDATDTMCPVCGSKHHTCEGYAYTTAGKYQRYRCKDCGKWYRGRKNVALKQTVNY